MDKVDKPADEKLDQQLTDAILAPFFKKPPPKKKISLWCNDLDRDQEEQKSEAPSEKETSLTVSNLNAPIESIQEDIENRITVEEEVEEEPKQAGLLNFWNQL